jgi:penicillin amidase
MAWDLRGNLDSEIDRALLLHELTADQVQQIYPEYPADHPLIVPNLSSIQNQSSLETSPGNDLLSPAAIIGALNYFQASANSLDHLTGGGFESIGSNSWAVSGDLTDTGKPYLANDPHLGAQMPSIWYEVGLHCLEKTEACQLDVTGFSFAGVPGIIIGHNKRIAWGFTNTGPDVMDLYIEKIHRDDANLYLTPDGWVELETITEIINVAGKDPVEHTVYLTRHGPLIGSVYGLDDFDQTAGIEVPEFYGLALQWTALEPTCVFCAIWDFNSADNWEEFRKATEEFSVPSQNLIYADVEGNIAYQMPGNIPIRLQGHDGMLPVPGWTTDYDWQGYIPFQELPYSLNPPEGYIVTANNAVVGTDFPYLITKDWSLGFRAQRIVDLLEAAPKPITMSYIKEMQGDNYDLLAEELVPFLLELQFSDADLLAAQQLLGEWDYQANLDSAPAALFMTIWQNLINNAIQDDLPDDYHVGVESRAKEIIRQLVDDPTSSWWDDASTKETELRDDILRLTFEGSFQEMVKEQGKDISAWNWGTLHTITFQNQIMNSFPFIKTAFNQGPFPASGGNEIINATGWDPSAPFVIDWLPSMRMVVDLNDLSNSISIHTTGQSGHAYHPHYIDMVDLWRKIYYHPMLWTSEQIKNQSESLLNLTP